MVEDNSALFGILALLLMFFAVGGLSFFLPRLLDRFFPTPEQKARRAEEKLQQELHAEHSFELAMNNRGPYIYSGYIWNNKRVGTRLEQSTVGKTEQEVVEWLEERAAFLGITDPKIKRKLGP